MAYGIDNNAKNLMLDAVWPTGASSGVYAALLVGSPPANAAAALAAEAAYNTGDATYGKRQQLNWNAASGGQKTLAAQPQFAVNGSQTITGVAYWKVASAGSASDYLGSQQLAQSETFGGTGTLTLTSETVSI